MIDLICRCNNFYGLVGTCSSVGKVFLNVHIYVHGHMCCTPAGIVSTATSAVSMIVNMQEKAQ